MEKIIEELIIAFCKRIDVHLKFGNFGEAKELYADLKFLIEDMPHDEMVNLVNMVGVTHATAGWIVKAWCDKSGISNSVIEFETAGCIGTPGDTFHYRRTKNTWGNLVAISNDEYADERAQMKGEIALRMKFWLKENNPIRLKQTTRNELKILLGPKLVNDAMSFNKGTFVGDVSPAEAARIERITGLPIGKVWTAIRNGNDELVERLKRIPSSKREQMRRRGMYVANHFDPQMNLFA